MSLVGLSRYPFTALWSPSVSSGSAACVYIRITPRKNQHRTSSINYFTDASIKSACTATSKNHRKSHGQINPLNIVQNPLCIICLSPLVYTAFFSFMHGSATLPLCCIKRGQFCMCCAALLSVLFNVRSIIMGGRHGQYHNLCINLNIAPWASIYAVPGPLGPKAC